jgi:hypothetical protein
MTLAISPGFERVDGGGVQAVFVAKGKVVEQVFDGEDVFFGEGLGDAGANAFDELDRSVECRHRVDASRMLTVSFFVSSRSPAFL